MSTRRIVWLIGLAAFLASCGLLTRNDDSSPTADNGAKQKRPAEVDPRDPTQRYGDPPVDTTSTGSLFAYFFGNSKKDSGGGGGGPVGVGVNSYLWRATLDTVSFMPLASADPFGGVIITEWYSPPDAQQERFKLNVFILDRLLRSDSLRAAIFHQHRGPNGDWVDVTSEPKTATDLENSILTRARQLRVSTAAAK